MAQPIRPKYIDPVGDPRSGAMPVRPPFLFQEVTTRVFPLKANMARLTHFCDQYLNMDIPPSIVHFRPSVPYVYLMVLDYGTMSAASVQAQNIGWVAQHEVAFTVPLERWREENGKLKFKDWACVSPFIFVDDQMSLTTGREVYGWPKVAGHVDAETPLWTTHPRSATRLFSLSTHVFPKVYAGEAETLRVLLEIDCDPSPSYSEFPPDPANPWSPLSAVPNAVRSYLSLTGNAIDMMLGLRMRGYRTDRNVGSLLAMSGKAGSYLARLLAGVALPILKGRDAQAAARDPGLPKVRFDNVTVKQFRDAQEPAHACYKALVSSTMGFDRLNQGGLLGDVNLLRGDPSAGYTVRIHRYASQPIIESLGLDVASTQENTDGAAVAILKPTFPFWTDVDLYYGKGELICSRTHTPGDKKCDDAWLDEQEDAAARPSAPPDAQETDDERAHSAYNTALGAATQPVSGPFHFPDLTLQVYPLLAERAQLDRFLDQYLNEPLKSAGLRFEAFSSYVYLMVNVCADQLGTMWSSANNIGWWAEREVSFCVPVKWYQNDELVSIGLVAPFVYSSNGRAVITDREVNGRPSWAASIESPKDVWLTRSGPVNPRHLLQLQTEVFPALNLGQKAEQRMLLEIDERDVLPYNSDIGWRMVAEKWGQELVEDLKRKTYERSAHEQEVQDAKALALEILAYEAPVNWITLKQYRDAADIERACYQAAIHTTRSITRIYDVREIEQCIHVRLHRFPGHPIAETLGLKIKSIDSTGGSVVENLQPIRPFWMRIALKEELGTIVGLCATDGRWTMTHPWFAPSVSGSERVDAAPFFRAPGETRVGSSLGQRQTLWQRLKEHAIPWLRRSLRSELAWIKANVQSLQPDTREGLRARLTPSERADFARLEAADSLDAFCDAASIESLIALTRALPQAGLTLAPLTDMPRPPSFVPSGDPQADLRTRLEEMKQTLDQLPEQRRMALEMTLSPDMREMLRKLYDSEGMQRGSQASDLDAQTALVVALEQSFQEWLYEPSEWRRLTHDEAGKTIGALDEVQLVIESILSDEWENWGNPRRYQNLPPKPEQCVPTNSVYGGASVLAEQRRGFAEEHGLSTSPDNAWWYVATSKDPGKQ